ncbi:hypothetical protein JYB87_02520 [Shewanella avicenniae]|uniref:Uncharacterized protein n=1 Tax=Shewanella avicenniae TaxID=2814294 RepID=A0ABX7QRP5_9GAMM|nr:hypothetical protein [Shewanella avicenniae]QSX34139.1 hypothetical protein JYB87_02520 [Shewanella avicenniae]
MSFSKVEYFIANLLSHSFLTPALQPFFVCCEKVIGTLWLQGWCKFSSVKWNMERVHHGKAVGKVRAVE